MLAPFADGVSLFAHATVPPGTSRRLAAAFLRRHRAVLSGRDALTLDDLNAIRDADLLDECAKSLPQPAPLPPSSAEAGVAQFSLFG